ncbi:(2Fe-2S)-binding protein [Paenibacillus koleovorans]|uniref:(2Fe-2S)-binding protein n=1 Tax=Paenibacillus koleovorans TaxID=121608 RepID=UPI000FDADD09|nr:(2Fe-2S)-binding protein [Paenibacillus koleovorans]
MQALATKIDYEWLEQKFGFRTTPMEESIFTIRADELSRRERMQEFLTTYGDLLKATDISAPAAYLAAYFSMVAITLQGSISLWNRGLELPLDAITIQLCTAGAYYKLVIVVQSPKETIGPEEENARHNWCKDTLRTYYRDTAYPLLATISEVSGYDLGQLWGQFPTRFNYYISALQQELQQSGEREPEQASYYQAQLDRLNQDYSIVKQLSADVFGRVKNPLDVKVRWLEDPKDCTKQIRMKNACCLYYKTGEGQYCYTCPRLKETDREERLQKLRSM